MFYFVGYRRSENLCPATHYLEDECFMDKKNKLADYAARIKKLGGSDINTEPVTKEEKLAAKECLETTKKFFLDNGSLYRAVIPHLFVRSKKILYGVEPVNHVELENPKYQDDGGVDALRKIVSIVRNDTFRRSSAITSLFFSAEMDSDYSGNIQKLFVDGDNIEPSATNKAWGTYHAMYDLVNYSVKGSFDGKNEFFDPIPGEIVTIVNKSREENDELASGLKTLLKAKESGLDLLKKNQEPDNLTRTDLIKKLSR